MTNTAGFKRKKARKAKQTEHLDIFVDASGIGIQVRRTIEQYQNQLSNQMIKEFGEKIE